MKKVKKEDIREFKKNAPKSKVFKVIKAILFILTFVLFFLGILLLFTAKWYKQYYSDVSFSQLLYHLYVPLEGTDTAFIDTFIPECLPIPSIITIVMVIVCILVNKLRKTSLKRIFNLAYFVISVCLFGYGVHVLMDSMNIEAYLENSTKSTDLYENYYVDCKNVEFEFPQEKRNLIYIFCESMEATYEGKKDGGLTSTDYIPELTKLQNNNQTFNGGDPEGNGYYVPTANGWTVAGIVGQTCGTPLNVDASLENQITDGEFLPNATSIGDILKSGGYTNEFICGSDIAFGGRENYLTQHGEYAYFDLNYARSAGYIPQDYGVWWGYEDAKLFDYAQEEATRLASEDAPFNLTLLTVDTHFPNGYTCQDCDNQYKENYSNVMSCSSKKINAFVEWCQDQDWYENTTIVIAGDHKTMDTNWFQNKDTSNYTRKAYYTIINSPITPERDDRREVCTYDFFPTTLAALNIKFNSDRLAFGTNLYTSTPTLTEVLGFEEFNTQLSLKSDYYINYLFGGRDVSKPLVTTQQEETTDTEEPTEYVPELPYYFQGTYNYHTGTTTNTDGSTSNGQSQSYNGTEQPSEPSGGSNENPGIPDTPSGSDNPVTPDIPDDSGNSENPGTDTPGTPPVEIIEPDPAPIPTGEAES